jgi:exopolysaccharide biosynthesis protein
VVVGSGATTSTAEAQTLTTATLTKSVTAPVITTADAALNGAKSYVVTFTVSDVRMFRHLVDNANPKTLSQWMTGITGATLAWNWSAWTASTGDLLPDLIVDGSVYDNVGLEESYDLARSCAAVLDLNNRLLTRDFHLLQPTTQPRGIAAAKVAEGAWQSANFRPPLVVDGAAYDPVPSGLLNTAGWTSTLGGRMSLGQRSDGTYVLVAVDGVSGSSGCTMQQLAAKHVALGSVVAHNLDGGGSVTLWYNGAVINSPSDAGGQRLIPSALYI